MNRQAENHNPNNGAQRRQVNNPELLNLLASAPSQAQPAASVAAPQEKPSAPQSAPVPVPQVMTNTYQPRPIPSPALPVLVREPVQESGGLYLGIKRLLGRA